MTHDPLRPEGTPPESPSTDPENLVDEEEFAAGEAEEGFEDEEEGAAEDEVPDPLDAPVPEPPPPADAREPEPVPAALWESEADQLDASVPRAAAGAQPEIDPRLLDIDAVKVINRLSQNEHEAYLVGGCVRDLLLGRTPKDFDIATSALPSEVRGTFRNCRLIGRRFRLAHVYFRGGKIIEVSTFRANPITDLEPAADGGVGEDRPEDLLINDDNVFGSAEQDARRRDFTINGLFYDVAAGRVVDFVRGRRDLEERLVRTIGDPERRMREDPIRLLRAVRFASRLGFDIEPRTYAAMEGAVEDLPRCAPPRLLEDTFRILRGGEAEQGLQLLSALDALRYLLPPIDAYLKERGPEGERTLASFARAADRRVKAGELLEDAVLLAVLLVPLMESAPHSAEDAPGAVPEAVESMLQELVRTARLPRRIAERCRMMLLAQSTLAGRRRRRGSPGTFRRHPLFHEALTVFSCTVEATGRGEAELQAWKSGQAPAPAPSTSPPAGRRRRRRRGGRRGGGGRPPAGSGSPA